MNVQEELIEQYSKKSKHSNYQRLPSSLLRLIPELKVDSRSRWEEERLNYIKQKIDVKNKVFLDVGGNTGYFSFELLDSGAEKIYYYEGNKDHADFVSLASQTLNLKEKIDIHDEYYKFDNSDSQKYYAVLLLNIIHHTGDDYGDKNLTIQKAKQDMIVQLNSIAPNTEYLIFQMGYNWHGDPAKNLFTKGTKSEVIRYIEHGIHEYWTIESIGIAIKNGDEITYYDKNDQNIQRDDSLGEFLNRPIFILKSKKSVSNG